MRSVCCVLLFGLIVLVGCATGTDSEEQSPPPAEATSESEAPGRKAAIAFLDAWNTRDPEVWAASLNYPHARPAAEMHRVWDSPGAYAESAVSVYEQTVATGWEKTRFEDLLVIHEGETKSHVAGHWARVDRAGDVIRENLVTYIATEVEGHWGIQARFSAGPPVGVERRRELGAPAVAKVKEFMTTFNARDPAAWAATLNYPHLRIASGEIEVWESAAEYADTMDFDAFSQRFGWDHSEWDEIEAIQISEEAVNVALTFSRYGSDGEVVATFNTLYLVTREADRWGIRARSSFAP